MHLAAWFLLRLLGYQTVYSFHHFRSVVLTRSNLWWPSELIYFVLVQLCLWYPVIGTYHSLLWVVLHNERILWDIKNLINVSLFSLFFVCLLYIYRCFAVLEINWIIMCEERPKGPSPNWCPNWIITCEDNKQWFYLHSHVVPIWWAPLRVLITWSTSRVIW